MGWATFWSIFLTNSSGHPVRDWQGQVCNKAAPKTFMNCFQVRDEPLLLHTHTNNVNLDLKDLGTGQGFTGVNANFAIFGYFIEKQCYGYILH
jgi:hypothetical protein